MSANNNTLRPPSLAQHFDAPDDYIGHFGWLCGYSGDALFLDDAAERFTRLTRSQRAYQGRIALAVMLDRGNPLVSLQDAPGVAHLPIIDRTKKPFRLLHAKVALLGFRHQENHSQWQLRLLVSTGNWTRQTLEESLDLVWRIDVSSQSLETKDAEIKQDCADIKAAWDLMEWIQQLFDTQLLNNPPSNNPSDTTVKQWIEACSNKAKGQSRFFDNRNKPLLSQLPEKVKACGREVKRNYLAMGSGFYETSTDTQEPPKVPLSIINTLHKNGLLTKAPEVDLYINPKACQSIANAVESLQEKHDITVRPAAIPTSMFGENALRSLHAKFLFSANQRGNSDSYNSAWVYLGSGNLTHPGFANKMSTGAGNLEAGAVFAPGAVYREKEKSIPEHQVVTNLLPIQWDEEIGIDDTAGLSEGSDMELRDATYIAPPIAWLKWHEVGSVRELRSDDSKVADIEVLDLSGVTCAKTKTGFQWCEAQPRGVCISWRTDDQDLEAWIPVVDQYGRIAATVLPNIDIEEAWWQLADFPMPPDDDDDGENDENSKFDDIEGKSDEKRRSASTTSYPIRQMMELIESIATKQTEIDERDWTLWCNRLEQILGQAHKSAPVTYFRDELRLNPLSPLKQPPFRPSFAENNDSDSGKLYDETLHRIEASWKTGELSPIGGEK